MNGRIRVALGVSVVLSGFLGGGLVLAESAAETVGVLQGKIQTLSNIVVLVNDLSSVMDEQLQADLADPTLLLDVHKADLYWVTDSGSLAVPAPAVVRLGKKLEALAADGVSFATTETTQRISTITGRWEARQNGQTFAAAIVQASLLVRDAAQAQGITQPSAEFIWNVLDGFPELRDVFIVNEASPEAPAYVVMSEPRPQPGELWCFELTWAWRFPYGVWCSGDGNMCQIQVPCPGQIQPLF